MHPRTKVVSTTNGDLYTLVTCKKLFLVDSRLLYCYFSPARTSECFGRRFAKGPLSTDKFEELETATLIVSTSKLFIVESEWVCTFIFNQGSFVLDKLTGLSEDELVEFIGDVGKLFLEAIDGIAVISAELDSQNNAANTDPKLLPILSNEIVALRHADFCGIVRQHQQRLLGTWTNVEIDALEQEHQRLQEVVKHEEVIREQLGKYDGKIDFSETWGALNGRFSLLQQFCGGFATVFPGRSQVESDF